VTPKRNYLAAACIVLAAAAMVPALRNGFTTWDDPQYVIDNPLVRSLSPGSVITMFTTSEYAGNYHPVTLVAIAAQYAAFGATPGGYHMVSLLLHLVATMLVYRIVKSLTVAIPAGPAGLAPFAAAALFGVHPLHLEPVAWIADQKDLLCTVFYLGAVFTYIGLEKAGDARAGGGKAAGGGQQSGGGKAVGGGNDAGGLRRRLNTVVLPLFALALLSKGIAVTLPVVLLLLDYHRERKLTASHIREKLPFFALSVLFGVVAIVAQSASGAIAAVEIDTPVEKLLYASQGYILYIAKLFVPAGLSPWYPYPPEPPAIYWLYTLFAAGVIAAALFLRKKAPLVFLGAAWYTVTVAPVLQFLQVGNAAMADRYVYLPSAGILLIIGWGLGTLAARFDRSGVKNLPWAAAGAGILAFGALTFTLAPVWADGVSLWTRVIDLYPTSPKGWFNRGHALHNEGKFTLAIADYNKTLELSPAYPYAWSNRGLSRFFSGDRAHAIEDFDRELRSRPSDPDVRFWRGNVLAAVGRYDEAAADLTMVLSAKPGNFEATVRRGLVYTAVRDFPKAEADFDAAIAARPSDPNLYFNRANVRAGSKRWDESIADYSAVLRLTPGDREAFYARGIAKFMKRDTSAACGDLRKASSLGSAQADTAIAEICNH